MWWPRTWYPSWSERKNQTSLLSDRSIRISTVRAGWIANITSARSSQLLIVIRGDFNARTKVRGYALFEILSTPELEIANRETTPTSTKGHKSSIVDLTFVKKMSMRKEFNWKVRSAVHL